MTEFEKIYQNYNPRQAALDEARALLTAAAKAAMADGALPEAELPAFIVEIPADTKNGDIASNIAMAGARSWRKAPKMIADALLAHLPSIENSVFAKVEVAGPGFINLFLARGKMFAAVCLDDATGKPVYITCKLDPAEGDFLRRQYEDIIPGYYMNKVHWNSVKAEGNVPDALLREMLEKSYRLVLGSFSKKKQRVLLEGEKKDAI